MVHFTAMRDLARKELVECFDQYSGPKVRDRNMSKGREPTFLSVADSCSFGTWP